MESVRFLEAGWELIDQANPLGNVIVRETDRGDLWDYNAPCKGTALAPTARPMPFPKAWEADFSTQYGGIGETGGGPVFAEFHLSGSFGEGSRRVRVRVYAHTPRIDFKTTLVNRQKWVRYRAAFPTSLRDGRIVHEVPFGAIERPEGEYPAQNWIDCCDGEKGLGLLNRGLPGNNVTAGVMMLSLLKSSTIPGQPCDGAFELGNEHQFDYALYPHGGDWQDAALPRRGLEYNFPLVVRAAGTAGRGPASFSLLRAEPENILVTSAASEGGRLQVRLYEAHGKRVPASLWLGKRIASVRETNLLGQPYRRKVFSEGEQIKFHIGPFEIRQFQIETD
jgi:alpha-mannosidase